MKIVFIGSGNVAKALGQLLRAAGHEVVLGSRPSSPPSAGLIPGASPAGSGAPAPATHADAGPVVPAAIPAELSAQLAWAELVILAIPFLAVGEVLPALASALDGKIVVDATNPVQADWSPLLLGQEHSAAEEIARLLPGARVVKAFNTIFADVMQASRLDRGGQPITCFVAGDDAAAVRLVADLGHSAGFGPRLVGPLSMARHLEALAHLNIQLAVGMRGGTNAAILFHQTAS
jgi:8-hydroxy-5-deazaflavin:NADPH oxidoreductase